MAKVVEHILADAPLVPSGSSWRPPRIRFAALAAVTAAATASPVQIIVRLIREN